MALSTAGVAIAEVLDWEGERVCNMKFITLLEAHSYFAYVS